MKICLVEYFFKQAGREFECMGKECQFFGCDTCHECRIPNSKITAKDFEDEYERGYREGRDAGYKKASAECYVGRWLLELARWVPVSERLPKRYGEYLVTKETRPVERGKASHRYIAVEHFGANSRWGTKISGVVAWIPVPEPWSADDE